MCSDVQNAQLVQAIEWVWNDLWDLLAYNIPEVFITMAVNDLVHLENVSRGGIGYDPNVVVDFPIGL